MTLMMRKHKRKVLRHIFTAEFHRLSKLGRRIIEQSERDFIEGRYVTLSTDKEITEYFNKLRLLVREYA